MHNSYFFLSQLSAVLRQRLQGFVLVSCFSQNKDELVIEFNNARQSFFVKASLQPALCCLSFPNVYHRVKKNSIDLFLDVLMKNVVSITQFDNERSFSINLESGWALLFKMHGAQSNVVLLQHEKVVSIFKNQFEADWSIDIKQLNRTIDWSKKSFIQSQENLRAKYFTLGREVWEYLSTMGFEDKSVDTKWDIFEKTLAQLREPTFFIGYTHRKATFSLLPLSNMITSFTDPIEAVNSFFQLVTTESALDVEKKRALKYLQEQIKNKKSFIERNERKLSELLNDQHYQLWGDLIMANMHRVKPGMEIVTLTNFYNQQLVNIKLKKELNAQRNAEVFYRKSKNQQIEITELRESIIAKQKEIAALETRITEVEQTTDVKQLRKENERAKPKPVTPLPYREVEFKGFKIWVGKSAEANDELTLKHSYKEDLWLHAKDVAGSHVLVKHQANKPFPKDVIERAAELAAYYSKRKNDTICPVTVTPKKFVRKRKGDPEGTVVVEKEDVLLVEPRN